MGSNRYETRLSGPILDPNELVQKNGLRPAHSFLVPHCSALRGTQYWASETTTERMKAVSRALALVDEGRIMLEQRVKEELMIATRQLAARGGLGPAPAGALGAHHDQRDTKLKRMLKMYRCVAQEGVCSSRLAAVRSISRK